MQEITPEGQRILADVASRNGVSFDAVVTLLRALVAGNGSQAQFSHPDLGGMGQWSQGGMIMVGDMFNQGLKYRVDTLCNELANLLRSQPLFRHTGGSFQSQSQGSGGVSLFVPGSGASFGHWWPAELGEPASTGAQNDLRYACFPGSRRLAIQQGGRVNVYDTGEHLITGFSQQQSGDQSLTFTSQFGLVRVADLPLVKADETRPQEAHATDIVAPDPSSAATVSAPQSMTPASVAAPAKSTAESIPSTAAIDIIATIERLADLRQKGVLTEEEFTAKKSELLSRL
jgi:Short C-terminal domain